MSSYGTASNIPAAWDWVIGERGQLPVEKVSPLADSGRKRSTKGWCICRAFQTSTAARMLQLFSSPWLQLAVTPVTHQRDAAAGSARQRHLNSGGCRV